MKIEQIPIMIALKSVSRSEGRDWQHSLERRSSKINFSIGFQYNYCNHQETEKYNTKE